MKPNGVVVQTKPTRGKYTKTWTAAVINICAGTDLWNDMLEQPYKHEGDGTTGGLSKQPLIAKFRDLMVRAAAASGGKRRGLSRSIVLYHHTAAHKSHRDTYTVPRHSNEWKNGLRDWDLEPDEHIGLSGRADRFL